MDNVCLSSVVFTLLLGFLVYKKNGFESDENIVIPEAATILFAVLFGLPIYCKRTLRVTNNIMVSRNEEKLNSLIKSYLKKYDCCISGRSQDLWCIKQSPLGGFGIFATQDIEPGELIFLDHPVLLGPRYLNDLPDNCTTCYCKVNIKKCNNCGLLVCESCSISENHLKECNLLQKLKNGHDLLEKNRQLTKCLTPLRSLLLDKEDLKVVASLKSHKGSQHGYEVHTLTEDLKLQFSSEEKEFLYFVCTVLDANAYEVSIESCNSNRGLYPLGSLSNHRCFPNVFHVFDEKHRMVVRASVFIPKNTELFNSYTILLWGTITRITHLKNTKHFICKCDRCKDPSEFGTYLSSVKCKKCPGNLLPINPLQNSNWQCDTCTSVEPLKEVYRTLSLVGSVLRGFNNEFELIHRFLTKKLITLVPDSNQVAVELKKKIIWILGYEQGYLLHELPLELLLLKRQFCKDILDILIKLKRGKCKLRGLLCYELYLCTEELKFRQNFDQCDSKIFEDDSKANLLEAIDILKYDSSVSDSLRQKINENQ